jgi:hypothetical protein
MVDQIFGFGTSHESPGCGNIISKDIEKIFSDVWGRLRADTHVFDPESNHESNEEWTRLCQERALPSKSMAWSGEKWIEFRKEQAERDCAEAIREAKEKAQVEAGEAILQFREQVVHILAFRNSRRREIEAKAAAEELNIKNEEDLIAYQEEVKEEQHEKKTPPVLSTVDSTPFNNSFVPSPASRLKEPEEFQPVPKRRKLTVEVKDERTGQRIEEPGGKAYLRALKAKIKDEEARQKKQEREKRSSRRKGRNKRRIGKSNKKRGRRLLQGRSDSKRLSRLCRTKRKR